MEPDYLLQISRDAVFVLLKVSTPILIIALVVGLIISLLQALTQIQENTLSFVPKIVSVFFGLILLMPYMLNTLRNFTDQLIGIIVNIN